MRSLFSNPPLGCRLEHKIYNGYTARLPNFYNSAHVLLLETRKSYVKGLSYKGNSIYK